jgi:predicted transcriptional regulator
MPRTSVQTVPLAFRVNIPTRELLERLSQTTHRTKAFLLDNAVRSYLDANEWQISATQQALDKANSPQATFADHESVAAWLDSWGSENELEPPQCR